MSGYFLFSCLKLLWWLSIAESTWGKIHNAPGSGPNPSQKAAAACRACSQWKARQVYVMRGHACLSNVPEYLAASSELSSRNMVHRTLNMVFSVYSHAKKALFQETPVKHNTGFYLPKINCNYKLFKISHNSWLILRISVLFM